MKNIILIAQIILAIFLIILILFQGKGTGLGQVWGGGGGAGFYPTRRGIEKILFKLTILIAAIFIITSIASLII